MLVTQALKLQIGSASLDPRSAHVQGGGAQTSKHTENLSETEPCKHSR